MKLLIIFSILVLVVVIILYRKKESFANKILEEKLKKGIFLNMGEIENLNDLDFKEIRNSEKILIENIIKNFTVKKLLFSKNLNLNPITDDNVNIKNKLELKYNKIALENVNNFLTSFAIGEQFSTSKENKYYGIQIKYKPPKEKNEQREDINRAEIGIEFSSYMEDSLNKLNKMSEIMNDKDYRNIKKEKVEVISSKTKKTRKNKPISYQL